MDKDINLKSIGICTFDLTEFMPSAKHEKSFELSSDLGGDIKAKVSFTVFAFDKVEVDKIRQKKKEEQ